MTQIANDTFTDTNGVELSAHTPDDGGSWTEHPDSGPNEAVIQSNRLDSANSTPLFYHSATPDSNEYDVEATYIERAPSGTHHAGITGRMNPAASLNAYYARHRDDVWTLFKVLGASFTSLGTFNESLTTNDERVFKLEIRDAAKKLFVAGVERISSTNNEITVAGKAGVRLDSDTASATLDDFSATDLVSGVSPVLFGKSIRRMMHSRI